MALLIAAISIQFGTSTYLEINTYYFVIFGIFALSLVYLLLQSIWKHYVVQLYLQILIDLFIITVLVYISGGLQGTFYFLYIFEIVAAGILLSGKAAYLTAALSSIFFGLLVDLLFFGVIPYFGGNPEERIETGVFLNSIFIAWSAFFLVALLSNYLTRNLRKTRIELDRTRRELEIKKQLALAGDMAAHLAHEIRNPLAAISGSIQVLSREIELTDEKKQLMDIVVSESRRISQSFDHFLSLSSPGKIVVSSFLLSDVLKEILFILQSSGDLPNTVELAGNFREADLIFYGSSNQFKQLFWNLIKNAAKAMPNGGTLTINLKKGKRRMTHLQFIDTGIGMSEERRKMVFEPFYSGFESGQGIGLSVVKRIVDEYRGTISLLSEKDVGTEILITFPAQRENGLYR
ncbi:MAG: HAMP domain-containing histidine kinase [Acidobacteria bacterium]|nr:HAMP domain-containing histidine kinase [Acidobacteriota bacterium]MBU1339661.1 HAMP domain-containing histidine kinase [Acidobacteriota bacterium]MBU1474041.1 HAMP domain-containing histidine kinase [Acidobacteriota bacterium]MBU2438484.1 HAMP domain-containing histidine kinase [Acidobacteriota bacterium]MBU4202926.1 HAMP domain-containing histidine kinase [Acidobacteriota bacterium]